MNPNDRNIRIFISSTFRDMHAEREELVKYTFPELRKRCRERGVELLDVDLRWGVTDEQKAEGQVLPICLAEIERCRPYFIGLLGERYGWVPDRIHPELIDDQPWLEEHREKSVTDLEIQHGVLEDPAMDGIAFFYFRDPETSKQVEAELANDPDYQPEPESARSKLEHLKKRIAESDAPLREDYPDAKILGQWIFEDLWSVIDHRFPEDQKPTALERTRMDHEAFAAVRRKVYIGRLEYYQRLDEHVAGDGPPLVLLGESGSGKSALLANWALKYQKTHPDVLVIQHYIGVAPYSTDWAAMLKRIMGEFRRHFNIEQDISDKSDELRSTFVYWLHMVAAKGKVILILDVLNQLEDLDLAPDLVWLPPVIPHNVRLIVSTLPGRPLDVLTKCDWPTFHIKLLEQSERQVLISQQLQKYTKALSQAQTASIVNAEQTTNPLYLKALLEELRVFGKHEELDDRIAYYLQAQTIPELYGRILERLEYDYEQGDHPHLVRDALSLIWACRRGLSESELLKTLALPRALWSPLYLSIEESFIIRSGFLGFSHDYLRKAVQGRYLSSMAQSLKGANWKICVQAAESLGSTRDSRAVEPLTELLCSTDAFVRMKAAESLGRIGDSKAVDPLMGNIEDEDWKVRRSTVQALGDIAGAQAMESLLVLLWDDNRTVRTAMVEALRKISARQTVASLVLVFERNRDRAMRQKAVIALGKIADADAVESLIKALDDGCWETRYDVAKALGEIGDIRAMEALSRTLEDKVLQVHIASVRALRNILSCNSHLVRHHPHLVCSKCHLGSKIVKVKKLFTVGHWWERNWRLVRCQRCGSSKYLKKAEMNRWHE